jgi:hypothetical protein
MPKALVFIFFFLSYCFHINAQIKIAHALKITAAPHIDGLLDEAIWQEASNASGFVTTAPVFGNIPTDSTIVKIIYDNTSVYIGAYLYCDPALIRKQYTPRDQERQADVDFFGVFIDSYNDRQNAYQFLVTARNVQTDARLSANIAPAGGIYGDLSWDAVWDSKVSMHQNGWSVELKIPLFSIRFADKENNLWGIQFLRYSRSRNETSFWNPENPNTGGFVNQFGQVDGLSDILPPLRLSFSPYVSGGYRGTPSLSDGYKTEWLKSGGMDVKYGISESFTLDATVVPDFGQVISDNVVNNISPFEIQFRENRPFFTEGTELFNKSDLFYSRRVGREPGGYQQIVDSAGTGSLQNYNVLTNPSLTRLYNAIKFSGRTNNNLGIGVFNAVAQSEKATIRNKYSGEDSSITTESLTNYNVFVLDQVLKNRSYFTLTNTNVSRNGNERNANVTGLDIVLYDKSNQYGLILQPRYSKIYGNANRYGGYKNYLEFGKVSGKLQFSVSNDIKSAKYDPNDLGFLLAPNEMVTTGKISYNLYQPNKWFLNQQYSVAATQSYLYKPFEYEKTEIIGTGSWTFKNFWMLQLEGGGLTSWQNDFFELQTPANKFSSPRVKLRRSPYFYLFASGNTDTRKRLYFDWGLGGSEGPLPDDPFYKVFLEARYRFSDRLTMTVSIFRQHDNGQFGYSFTRDSATHAPILARRQYTDVTSIISGIYNFTPRMSLTFRARHYWNRILNTNVYDVKPDGYWTDRMGTLNARDLNMNYNVFNMDAFYTWDFRPGSRIIFAWKNSLSPSFEDYINGSIYKTYLHNASRVLEIPHSNEVTVRFIYFLDYQQFKKRH